MEKAILPRTIRILIGPFEKAAKQIFGTCGDILWFVPCFFWFQDSGACKKIPTYIFLPEVGFLNPKSKNPWVYHHGSFERRKPSVNLTYSGKSRSIVNTSTRSKGPFSRQRAVRLLENERILFYFFQALKNQIQAMLQDLEYEYFFEVIFLNPRFDPTRMNSKKLISHHYLGPESWLCGLYWTPMGYNMFSFTAHM